MAGAVLAMVCAWLLAPPRQAFAEESTPSQTYSLQVTLSSAPPTPEEAQRAHQRARQSRIIYFGTLAYEILLLGGFLLLGGTRWLARLVEAFHGRWVLATLAVFLVVSLATALLTLPLDYYAQFTFQHQYGLSNQTPWQWLRDYLVGQGIGLLIGMPLMVLGYFIIRRAPHTWWAWLGAIAVPVLIFAILLEPVFIAPLFNKFTPLQNPQLRQDILTMAHAHGIAAKDVYQVDASRQSNAVNAYVNGVGPTKRIVLYDTLLAYFTPDEIKFIMAHEMGHYVLGHIRQGLLIAILGVFAGAWVLQACAGGILGRFGGYLGVRDLSNPAALPVLLAVSLGISLLVGPIGNAFSRHIEAAADRYAVTIYPHPEAGISAFHKLARLNISEENPPRWVVLLLYTHPSLGQRIAMLQDVERRTGEK